MKLDISNVKAIYNNDYGQALSSTNPKYGILMINTDNTVSYISISDIIDGNISTIKLNSSEISNVITENPNGYITYLLKLDGSKIDANTLIK